MPFTIAPPLLPYPPRQERDILDWASRLNNELQRWFDNARDFLVDYRVLAKVSRQEVSAGFVVTPDNLYVELLSTSPVTSDLTNAIEDGVEGQLLILENINLADSITIANNATTKLHGAVDYTLTPNSTLTLRWDSANWVEVAHSDN